MKEQQTDGGAEDGIPLVYMQPLLIPAHYEERAHLFTHTHTHTYDALKEYRFTH